MIFRIILLIFLFLTYYFIKWINPPIKFNNNSDLKSFVSKLNALSIKNIFYEILLAAIYIFFSIIIFFFIRINLLFNPTDMNISNIPITYFTLINMIIIILIISYYMRIVKLLFYPYVNKIHLYLFQYEWYRDFDDFFKRQDGYITIKFISIQSFFSNICFTHKQYLDFHRLDSPEELKTRFTYKYITLAKKYILLKILFKYLSKIIHKIDIDSRFFTYLPYTMMFIVFIYDCFHNKIHFTAYASIILFLILTIRRIRTFYVERDPYFDHKISTFLYHKKLTELNKEHMQILQENNSNKETLKELLIQHYQDSITNYIIHEYKRDILLNEELVLGDKISHKYYRRINLLLLPIIGCLYYYVNSEKYLIIFGKMHINISLLFVFITIVFVIIQYKTIYYIRLNERKYMKESNVYKWLFKIIFLLIVIPMLYIMLKNKLTLSPIEVIFEFKDYIKITEMFTIQDKQIYFNNYLEYLKKVNHLNEQEYTNLVLKAKIILINLKNISIENIKVMLDNIMNEENIPIHIPKKKSWFGY